MTAEKVHELAEAGGTTPFAPLLRLMEAPILAACERDRPDLIAADFVTFAASKVALQIDIPLVVNVPGPLSMVNSLLGLMDSSTHSAAFGFHFGRTAFSMFSVLAFFNIKGVRDMTKHLGEYIGGKGALTLVQTVWGLDRPQPLPPSIVVTGPVLPSPGDLRETLTREYPELRTFLKGSPTGVVLVTTGSLAQLYPWQVEAIFHGLKQAKCRVVWGLKEAAQAHLPSSTDPDFYISKWIPQAALLQDSAVRVVITHCGWGGTLECVVASKPIVAIPFFGDQPENASLRVSAGAGEYIGKVPAGGMDMNPYKEGDFTAKTVATAVAKIMANPDYTKAVAKMAKSSRASGGAEAAAQQIEWAARFGTSQLHYPLKRTNPLSGLLLAAAGFAALVGYRLVRK